jgi:hypothetical protein
MKNIFNNKSKAFYLCAILLCMIITIALTGNLLSTMTSAQVNQYYPEPSIRPQIREDAVWDTALGMYISGDYIKGTDGKYQLNPDIFFSGKIVSPEEQWLLSHSSSNNEIDMAIIYSIELISKEEPNIYSAISPRSSGSIITAMKNLSVSSYPEIWERVCLEPAYRAQKIIALEMFLNISFDDLGLYDSWAQRVWYESFNELKNNISNSQITAKEAKQYGNLLLPMLSQKAHNATIVEAELNIFKELISDLSTQFNYNLGNLSIESSKDALEWTSEHTIVVDAIEKIIESNYEWKE